MKFAFIILLLALLVFPTMAMAGTVYDLTNQLAPAGTPGIGHQSLRCNMTPLGKFTVLADNRTTTASMMMYQKTSWPSGAFDSLLDIDGAAGAGSLNATLPSMIHNLGETLFVDMVVDAGPQTHSRYTNFTFVSRDTLPNTNPSTSRIAGSWYLPGDSMIVIGDKDLATDSSELFISNGTVGSGTVWTDFYHATRIANAGLFIPIYDGAGQSRYALKFNLNTSDILIVDRINGVTTVSTDITSGFGDLITPGYWAGWICHVKADTFVAIYQKGLTGTKGLFARPFYITWTGTTPTGVGFNASEQTLVASGSFPDSLRSCPTGSFVYNQSDTGHIFYALGTTKQVEGVYRATTYDGGRTFQSAVKEIDTSEVAPDKFWSLQAPPHIRSDAGTQLLGLAFADSVTTAGSSHLFAWTDTLQYAAAASTESPIAKNSNAGLKRKASKDGGSAKNRK